jgi:hypothetical protein
MLPEPTTGGRKTRNLGFGTPHLTRFTVAATRRGSPGTPGRE